MACVTGNGKSLEQSAEFIRARLSALGFNVAESNWLNPVPNVWSVKLSIESFSFLSSVGHGVSRIEALLNGLESLVERLSCHHFFSGYYLGPALAKGDFVYQPQEQWFALNRDGSWPDGLLDDATHAHYDLNDELDPEALVELGTANSERGICALPFIHHESAQNVWFPVSILDALYIGNGSAAGCDPAIAKVNALSEIIERHVKSTIIASGISLPVIPKEVLAQYTDVMMAVRALRAKGFLVEVRDASLGGQFPLVNISLLNPQDGGCRSVFGAHPKFHQALQRAITALLQNRTLDQLSDLTKPTFDMDSVSSATNLLNQIQGEGQISWDMLSDSSDYPFAQWNIEGDAEAEFAELVSRIEGADMDLYISESQYLGVYSCQIIVPGMSELHPLDTLFGPNSAELAQLREILLALPQLSADGCSDLLAELDELEVGDTYAVAELLGLFADEGSDWASLKMAELKLLLALASHDYEYACDQLLRVMRLPLTKQDRQVYQCLQKLLTIELDPNRQQQGFERIYRKLFSDAVYEASLLLLNGEGVFDRFGVHDSTLADFANHQQLLSVYRKLLRIKSEAQH